MYIRRDLKSRVTHDVWVNHVATQLLTVVEDLLECDSSYNTIRGMAKKVLKEAKMQPHECTYVIQRATHQANKKGKTDVAKALNKTRY